MDRSGFQAATNASNAVMADLDRYFVLLQEGNAVMNLVGPASLSDFWNRHAWDSAQLLQHAPDARTWADLGAGAGLPGVILAAFFKQDEGRQIWLVDSQAKRCRFLERVVAELDLPAEVINARAEDLHITVDAITARACAPLDRLLGYSEPFLKRGAEALFLKGEQAEAELAEARRTRPRLSADLLPSLSDPRGRIVHIRSRTRAA